MPSFSALSFAVVVTPPFPSKPLHLRRLCASAQRRERHSSPDPPLPPPRVPVLAAPWMRAPLLVPREDALHLPGKKSKPEKPDASKDVGLTAKIRGGRSRYAMRRIIRTVERLREVDPEAANEEEELARDSEQEWRGPRAPWVRPRRLHVFRRQKKLREVTQAEVKLDRELLERLRVKARGMRTWAKAKKCGVTDEVVEEIRRTWKWSELAMVRIVEPLSKNMDRAREIVETKTGGLVVWTKKDKLVIYRGTRLPLEAVCGPVTEDHMINSPSAALSQNHDYMTSSAGDFNGISIFNKDGESPPSSILSEINNVTEPVSGTLYMRETDRLLDGLGPRFVDWWMRKPLPVDADLLTEVPDFESPRRICVPHTRATLTDDELTYLRKIARPLPIHFALGRNTKLEGLAAAIIKLWERSLIAKIAVKQGILNTNYKIMSSKLKCLTGGTLILCNKFYIILYRGKDFLPPRVADSVFEREIELRDLQVEEEQARQTVTEIVGANDDKECDASIVGTFKEFQDIQKNLSLHQNKSFEMRVKMEAEKENLEKELRKQKRQLSIMRLKQGKSQEIISKINNSWGPAQLSDKELLTEEERQKFRKIGLKMDEVLMLGTYYQFRTMSNYGNR